MRIITALKIPGRVLSIMLCGFFWTRSQIASASDFEGFWSDRPAYTVLFPHQITASITTDANEGGFQDKPLPKRPNPPVSLPSRQLMGEGVDVLCARTYALTNGAYTNPARLWEGEPYPLGNGFMGVSVFHGSGRDRYTLSENSFWSGGANSGINAQGDKPYNGSHGPNSKTGFGGQQPVADLLVDFGQPVASHGFRRELDFDAAEARGSAYRNEVLIQTEAFCSYPHRLFLMRYTAARPIASVTLSFARNRAEDTLTLSPQSMILDAALPNGITCRVESRLLSCDAASCTVGPDYLRLEGVRSWVLATAVETNYVMNPNVQFRGSSAASRCAKRFETISHDTFETLQAAHRLDTQALYRRQAFHLETPASERPTPQRLAQYRNNPMADPQLEALFFAFGRYLLIATSRPGGLPAGLQGLWNPYPEAPWGNDYHSNINAQMVYWLAERGALPECHRPFLDYILAMRPCFQRDTTAYLAAIHAPPTPSSGWLIYTSHNPFGAGGWQMNLPASAWYALHFRDHAAFKTPSQTRWQEALPLLNELSHFWLTRLKTLGPNGYGVESNGQMLNPADYPELANLPEGTLVVPKGWSPEHGPRDEDGVAHDQQIVRELFLATLTAAREADAYTPLHHQIEAALERLAPPQIGRKGNLMEWLIDRNPETDHRHTSHLFALYPGTTISPQTTPLLALAAERSLSLRKTTGDSRRSWAWAWRAALWARLKRGDKAHEMVQGLLRYNVLENGFASHRIPLQIDGNYGIAAAILEQLVYTRPGLVELLPALPAAWPSGSLKGMRAHDGLIIDLKWQNGCVTEWKIDAPVPTTITLLVNGQTHTITAPCQSSDTPQ